MRHFLSRPCLADPLTGGLDPARITLGGGVGQNATPMSHSKFSRSSSCGRAATLFLVTSFHPAALVCLSAFDQKKNAPFWNDKTNFQLNFAIFWCASYSHPGRWALKRRVRRRRQHPTSCGRCNPTLDGGRDARAAYQLPEGVPRLLTTQERICRDLVPGQMTCPPGWWACAASSSGITEIYKKIYIGTWP